MLLRSKNIKSNIYLKDKTTKTVLKFANSKVKIG